MIFNFDGIRINLTFSFIAVIILMVLFCEEDVVILSLISSIIHEAGHLFFMLIFKERDIKIKLGAFGMRIERKGAGNLSYRKEIIIASGGIIFNFLLVAFFLSVYCYGKNTLCLKTAIVNLTIIAVNSLPIGMLDMGKALEYLLKIYFSDEKSERIIDKISYLCVIIFLIITVIYLLIIGNNISLIAVTVYLVAVVVLRKKRS